MPVINIYLDEELFEFVKSDKSKIVQEALREYQRKQMQLKNSLAPSSPA